MNDYDTELIRSILQSHDYDFTTSEADADVLLLNTCAIRENAHGKIYARLGDLKHLKTQKHINHGFFTEKEHGKGKTIKGKMIKDKN